MRKKSGKKPGGQKGHRGHHLQRVQQADEIVVHHVSCCENCGTGLEKQAVPYPQQRQVFDVPPQRLWVIEHRIEEKACPACQHVTRADFPQTVRGPAQYGAGLAGLVVYLVQGQFVPYARAAQLLQEWFGVSLLAGSLASFIKRCHHHLEPVERSIKEALLEAPVLHQDETRLRVQKKT